MDFDQFISDESKDDKKRVDVIRVLKGIEFFKDLDDEELDAVSKCITERSVKAGIVFPVPRVTANRQ